MLLTPGPSWTTVLGHHLNSLHPCSTALGPPQRLGSRSHQLWISGIPSHPGLAQPPAPTSPLGDPEGTSACALTPEWD